MDDIEKSMNENSENNGPPTNVASEKDDENQSDLLNKFIQQNNLELTLSGIQCWLKD